MPSLHFLHPTQNGPKQIRLFKKITTLGADAANDIPLKDDSIEASHAYIVFDGRQYTISGVSKKSPITVNGRKVRSASLAHKDVVSLGDLSFTLDLFDELGASPRDHLQLELAGFRKLHEFTEKLMSGGSLEELLNHVIDLVIELTGADNGFLILKREDQGLDFTVARNLNRESIENAMSEVSDSIISRALESRRSIIVSDALNDREFGGSASVMNLKLNSVMCVPLITRSTLLGLLYVGSRKATNLFMPDQLQLLELIAAQASLLIQNAILVNELKLGKKELSERIEQLRYGQMIGSCDGMREVFKKIERIAPIDIPVLIQGETGTGKELVAKEIHHASPRVKGPFVAINCGAIPRELLESELFGHLRGAFTGAVATKMGKFKAANGGTLFLDEVGDMPIELQVKLLRALEERRIVPVGDTKGEDIDIRIVAATNRPLEKAIQEGKFREDLYYRLNVVTLWLPPLRERGGDALLIAKYILNRYAGEYDRKIKGFSPRAIEAIHRHAWPGNVRELENRIKKAIIMAEKNLIEPEDLDLSQDSSPAIRPLAEAREEFQRTYILEALRRNGGNRTKTALMLDVDPRTIFRYLEKIGDE